MNTNDDHSLPSLPSSLPSKKKRQRRSDGYSVSKRPDGRWEARVVIGYNDNGNPKRKSFYGKTRAEVLEEAKKYKRNLDDGGFAPVGKDATLAEWLDQWLDLYIRPRREPKTVSFYEAYARIHIKPVLGTTPLRKLSAQHIQKLLNEKSAEGLSASFVRGLRATLRAALNQAWKDGAVEQNVAARVTPPKLVQADPTFLDLDEIHRFLDQAKGHPLEHLFRFALVTGLRVGEATGLRWSDVDFEGRSVAITRQLQRVDGALVLKDLKSRSSRRQLPMSGIALDALQEQRSRHLIEAFDNPLDLVFLNPEGRPLDPKYVHKHLKAVLAKAKVREVSFHKLRHTAATLMVASGVDLHRVKNFLGHSQINLTANLYAQSVTESQRLAAESLDRVLREGKL